MRHLLILMLLSILTLVGCNDDMADIAKTMEQTEDIDKTFNINISDEEFKGLRCNSSLPSSRPIYIIDGQPISKDKLKAIHPNEIKSITVLKGVKATALYGSRAKDGVISIKLKP